MESNQNLHTGYINYISGRKHLLAVIHFIQVKSSDLSLNTVEEKSAMKIQFLFVIL